MGELVPVPVDVRNADRDFWRRYHVIRRMWAKEIRPDDPIMPDRLVEARMKKENPYEFEHPYEISRDGVTLGWFCGQALTPASPEYATNKHFLWAWAYVRQDHRREGIATLFLPVVADLMDGHGCTVVEFHTEGDFAHGFLEWLGAHAKMTEIESRLELSKVDWAMVERWVTEGQARSPQTRLEIYDGPIPEPMWAEFTPQLSAMLNTIPFEDLDHGEIVVTPETMREWYERNALSQETQHTVLTREPDGVISGITDVTWAPYRRPLIYQRFTGVRPDSRGRGLGKWLKAAMLLHLRELYPDARWIATGNARSNAPMLKINRTLGFDAYKTGVEYQLSRGELESRIRS
ncbi:MAG TPA: hypothetical protein VJP81_10570 [Candidatus Dormibacteraeota bacterium]|nr:hypothetical protein [Candidatus Dormibacteraeota bacterium]